MAEVIAVWGSLTGTWKTARTCAQSPICLSLSLSWAWGPVKVPGHISPPSLALSLSFHTDKNRSSGRATPLHASTSLSLCFALLCSGFEPLSSSTQPDGVRASRPPPPSRASSRTGGVTERLTQLVKLRLHHRFSHHNTQNSINHFPPRRISVSPPYDRFWISTAKPERRTSRPCPSYRRVAGTHTYPMQTLKRKPQHTAVCMCASLSLSCLLAC